LKKAKKQACRKKREGYAAWGEKWARVPNLIPDKQSQEGQLSRAERQEAEGLVQLYFQKRMANKGHQADRIEENSVHGW
jgi:hypothetical protein